MPARLAARAVPPYQSTEAWPRLFAQFLGAADLPSAQLRHRPRAPPHGSVTRAQAPVSPPGRAVRASACAWAAGFSPVVMSLRMRGAASFGDAAAWVRGRAFAELLRRILRTLRRVDEMHSGLGLAATRGAIVTRLSRCARRRPGARRTEAGTR